MTHLIYVMFALIADLFFEIICSVFLRQVNLSRKKFRYVVLYGFKLKFITSVLLKNMLKSYYYLLVSARFSVDYLKVEFH